MTWLMWDDEAGTHVRVTPEAMRSIEEQLPDLLPRLVVEAGSPAQWAADLDEEDRSASRQWIERRVRGYKLAAEILDARDRSHAKHGVDSIEGVPADDPAWLAILVEEVGEIAHALTYDSVVSSDETKRLRLRREALEGELVDVLAVASAWLDASRTGRGLPVDTTASDAEAANDTRPTS